MQQKFRFLLGLIGGNCYSNLVFVKTTKFKRTLVKFPPYREGRGNLGESSGIVINFQPTGRKRGDRQGMNLVLF